MPEYVKAPVIIGAIGAIIFSLFYRPLTRELISTADYIRRVKYWFILTFAGFLLGNFWIYLCIVSVLAALTLKKDTNPIAGYLLLVFAMPNLKMEIPGIFGIRYLVEIGHVEVMTIFILLPLCIREIKLANSKERRQPADIFLSLYLFFNILLTSFRSEFTGLLRMLFFWFVGMVIPYYAASRNLKTKKSIEDVLASLALILIFISTIGIFEFLKSWLLYAPLNSVWQVARVQDYLSRGDILRAVATSGQPIVLGYMVMVGVGAYLLLIKKLLPRAIALLGFVLLVFGSVASVSRGPWVGTVAMLMAYLLLGANKIKNIFIVSGLSIAGFVMLYVAGYADKLIDYLPFVGTVESGNIDYRRDLFDTSVGIIKDNWFLGSDDYLLRMEHLRQGQGIIDLVNTYLIVALNAGIVGLSMYIGFFFAIMSKIIASFRVNKVISDPREVGRVLLVIMIGELITIATVSPINFIGPMLWVTAGIGLAYVRMTDGSFRK